MAKTEPFNKYTQRYESWFDRHAFAYRAELAALRQLMPSGLGVETGVGTGRFANPLGRSYQQHKHENVFYQDAIFYSADEIVALLENSDFKVKQSRQTVFHTLQNVAENEPVEYGYGRGSFVAMQAVKIK